MKQVKEFTLAKEYLLRAYLLAGDEIFEETNPKYKTHLKDIL